MQMSGSTSIDVQGLLSQMENGAQEYCAERPESTFIAGLSARGKREILSFRSPDAELVPIPGPETIYEIGSFSKVYTTSVLAVLEAQGHISLEDPISKYVPVDMPTDVAGITIRQLATHTSGLARVCKIFGKMAYEDYRTCYLRYRKEDLYEELRTVELAYPPGQGSEYSIIGMGTLGHILELVAGKPFEALLAETICEPLGLKDTGYELSDDQLSRVVRGYASDGEPMPSWYHDVLLPQGGLRSTMTDMLTFAEANLRNDGSTLLKALSRTREHHVERSQALTPIEGGPKYSIQGLAWWGFETPKGTAWRHDGCTLYYQSSVSVCEPAAVALVALTSYGNNLPNGTNVENILAFGKLAEAWFARACE